MKPFSAIAGNTNEKISSPPFQCGNDEKLGNWHHHDIYTPLGRNVVSVSCVPMGINSTMLRKTSQDFFLMQEKCNQWPKNTDPWLYPGSIFWKRKWVKFNNTGFCKLIRRANCKPLQAKMFRFSTAYEVGGNAEVEIFCGLWCTNVGRFFWSYPYAMICGFAEDYPTLAVMGAEVVLSPNFNRNYWIRDIELSIARSHGRSVNQCYLLMSMVLDYRR